MATILGRSNFEEALSILDDVLVWGGGHMVNRC